MGQRGIGLIEQSNGKYNAFYNHWLPVGNIETEKSMEEFLIGDKDPVKQDISKREAFDVAVDHGAMTVFIIDKGGEVSFINREELID